MDRVEADETPAAAWRSSLNATCNRLTTQYLNLLRAAAGPDRETRRQHDPRAGGGAMTEIDEPPPPLAADTSLSALQAELAGQNLCVASVTLVDLIRTLRLSALLMHEESIAVEEMVECATVREKMAEVMMESEGLEEEWMRLRNGEVGS